MTPAVDTKLLDGLLESEVSHDPIKIVSDTRGIPAFENDEFTKGALIRRRSLLYRTPYREKAPRIVWDVTTRRPHSGESLVSHSKLGLRSVAVITRQRL